MINLRETLGVAVNTGSLSVDEDNERAADRVAALGFTEELGSLLWRAKYGGQRHYREVVSGADGLPALARITLRLEHWLRKREQRWQKRGELLPRLVQLALADWLNDKCAACMGRGMLGVERAALQSVRLRCPHCAGRGHTLRTTERGHRLETVCVRCCGNRSISALQEIDREKPRPCPACNGLGLAVLTPAMWAVLLGVSTDEWLKTWEKPQLRLREYLNAVDRRTHARIKAQLGRDNNLIS